MSFTSVGFRRPQATSAELFLVAPALTARRFRVQTNPATIAEGRAGSQSEATSYVDVRETAML
jgi:hypothetical protein